MTTETTTTDTTETTETTEMYYRSWANGRFTYFSTFEEMIDAAYAASIHQYYDEDHSQWRLCDDDEDAADDADDDEDAADDDEDAADDADDDDEDADDRANFKALTNPVLVETVPVHLRSSFQGGFYPHNGTQRFVAEDPRGDDPSWDWQEWTEILRRADLNDALHYGFGVIEP